MVLALYTLSNADVYMKFHEDSLKDFQVTEPALFCDRQTDRMGKKSKD